MRHLIALAIKYVMITLVLWVVLGIFSELLFTDILVISLVVTILAYIIGDLLILPMSNNTIATISDVGLSLVTILIVTYLWIVADVTFLGVLIASVCIGVGEWFFHKYIYNKVLHD
ncbi:MAG TPA: DUF2512 family protein [Lachnospiraceae bacterium]|nr:DUF2512 family protein [Lachnospiraceae bacterium]